MDNNIVQFDICIVGASIAGNYLCYLLSNSSLKIIILEEHKEIGLPFQCAGIVSQKLATIIKLPNDLILNRVNIAKIVAPSGKFIKLSGNERPYIIDRVGLDRYLYNKSKIKKNVSYSLGEKYRSFEYIEEEGRNIILVGTNQRKIKVKLLIGCDGPSSLVAQHLDIKNNNLYAMQIRTKGNFPQNEAAMYFNPMWKELFGWIVPEGNNIYRIGIASASNISKNFRLFLDKLGIDFNKKIDQQGGLIPYGLMNRLAFDNVLLLGDSANQVKATTGGGIIMLLTAAHYASKCIIRCIKDNNYSRTYIRKYYEKPCYLEIGKELKIHYQIRLILEHLDRENFDNLIQIAKISKIQSIISFYGDMDFPKSLTLRLLFNPLVIKFLLRFFTKNPELFFRIIRNYFFR